MKILSDGYYTQHQALLLTELLPDMGHWTGKVGGLTLTISMAVPARRRGAGGEGASGGQRREGLSRTGGHPLSGKDRHHTRDGLGRGSKGAS